MNDYYFQHITKLGDKESVFTTEDILNKEGVKLIAKGITINQSFLSMLLKHKLLKPIDLSISISNTLTPGEIKKYAIEAIENTRYLQAFLPNLHGLSTIISYIGQISLNSVLANKMTVMRHRLPVQFEHSLIVAFVCLFLGKISKVSESDMRLLANIGLFHDIGVLHIDPSFLDTTKEIDVEQWRQIHTHPLIGFLILNEQHELNPSIKNAILEHHERIDGSGYPRKLKGNDISYFGRIIAVAETAIGICQKAPYTHLSTILKSNINTLDKNIVQALNHVLYEATLKNTNNHYLSVTQHLHQENIQESAKTINKIFSFWYKHIKKCDSQISELIKDRLGNIQRSLIQSGISPIDTLGQLNKYEPDLIINSEIASLLYETIFQLRKIIDEAQSWDYDNNEYDTEVKEWISFTDEQLRQYNKAFYS